MTWAVALMWAIGIALVAFVAGYGAGKIDGRKDAEGYKARMLQWTFKDELARREQDKLFDNLRIWQCGYCGRVNPGTTMTCMGCQHRRNPDAPRAQPLSTTRPAIEPTDTAYKPRRQGGNS